MLVSVLSILFILVCPLIIFIVLVQDPKGGGLAGVLGGAGGGSAFGAQTPKVVMKVTVALGIIFFAIALGMSFALKGGEATVPSIQQQEAPPAPAPQGQAGAPAAAGQEPQGAPAESAPSTGEAGESAPAPSGGASEAPSPAPAGGEGQ